MKKILTILLIAIFTCVNAIEFEAAPKKARRAAKRTTTTTTTASGNTSTGISIKTFCTYDNSKPKAGRAIVLKDTTEIFSDLRAAGYRLDKVAEGNVSYSSPGVRCQQHKADYYWFVGPTDRDLVVIRPGRVEIIFKKQTDGKTFLKGMKNMGFKYDAADSDGDMYYDQFNDMNFGTIIQDQNMGVSDGSIFIWDKSNH